MRYVPLKDREDNGDVILLGEVEAVREEDRGEDVMADTRRHHPTLPPVMPTADAYRYAVKRDPHGLKRSAVTGFAWSYISALAAVIIYQLLHWVILSILLVLTAVALHAWGWFCLCCIAEEKL